MGKSGSLPGWQLCRGISGSFRVEWVAGFVWNQWQPWSGIRKLTQAKADGTYQKTLNQLAKVKLLILDDWGLEALKPAHRNDLMEIMDDRHGTHSTMIISQLPTDQWYAAIGDNTLADAILDRLMHNAHRWALKGESMRKRLQEID